MKRRTFLKLIGGVIAGSVGIGKLFATRGFKTVEPITINRVKYYVMILHSKQHYNLKVLMARDRWKHENHIRRWEKRYGKQYPKCESEAGSFEGVRFVVEGEDCPAYKEQNMLYQLHWQFKDGTTEMRAQAKINSNAEMRAFEKETVKSHPLPKGAQWLMCNEKSRHFVWAAGEDSGDRSGNGFDIVAVA